MIPLRVTPATRRAAADARKEARRKGIGSRFTIPLDPRFMLKALIFHAVFGLSLKVLPSLATLHALSVVIVAVVWLRNKDSPIWLAFVLAYIAGGEILWRMMKADVFWEFGKYSTTLVCILGILKFKLWNKASKGILVYFALLIPSMLQARSSESISFTLSGPLALAFCTLFFSSQTINREQLRGILFSALLPLITTGVIVLLGVASAGQISFQTSRMASGGIGQNQVSSALAMGAMVGLFLSYLSNKDAMLRKVFILAGLWLAGHAVLTFSRGGVYSLVAALLTALLFAMLDKKHRGGLLLRVVVLAGISVSILYPILYDYTEGAIAQRYVPKEQTRRQRYLTNRDVYMNDDLKTFEENIVFGVGVGVGQDYHTGGGGNHTEFTRLLAEHGMLGVLALLILLAYVAAKLSRKSSYLARGFSMSCIVFAISYTFHQSMRLAIPSFLFGLAMARLELSEEAAESPAENPVPDRNAQPTFAVWRKPA